MNFHIPPSTLRFLADKYKLQNFQRARTAAKNDGISTKVKQVFIYHLQSAGSCLNLLRSFEISCWQVWNAEFSNGHNSQSNYYLSLISWPCFKSLAFMIVQISCWQAENVIICLRTTKKYFRCLFQSLSGNLLYFILFYPIALEGRRGTTDEFRSCPVFSGPGWAGRCYSWPLFDIVFPPLLLSASVLPFTAVYSSFIINYPYFKPPTIIYFRYIADKLSLWYFCHSCCSNGPCHITNMGATPTYS